MSQVIKYNDCNEGKHHPSEKRDDCSCDCYESTNAGSAGNDGAQGPAGNDGAPGLQGLKGDTGAQGPQGSAGPAGPQGPAGPANIASKIYTVNLDGLSLSPSQTRAFFAACNPGDTVLSGGYSLDSGDTSVIDLLIMIISHG